jgi:hypothetical protein
MRITCLWGRTPSETGSPAPVLYADILRISIGGALRPVGHSDARIPFHSFFHCLRLRVRYKDECCIVTRFFPELYKMNDDICVSYPKLLNGFRQSLLPASIQNTFTISFIFVLVQHNS